MSDTETCLLCKAGLADKAARTGKFCCPGCQAVYQILTARGETSHAVLQQAARRMGLRPAEGEEATGESFPPDPAAMRDEQLGLGGLSCPSCSWVVEQVLLSCPGVERASVDYFAGSCAVRYDLRRTSRPELQGLLSPLGYSLDDAADIHSGASRVATRSFVVCAVLTMNLMTLATVRYFHHLGWLDQTPGFLGWLELCLTLPVLYFGWLPMARRAWAGLRSRQITMDLLIAGAAGAAAALSAAALLAGREEIYFETAAGLVTISLLGRTMEARLRLRAFAELSGMLRTRVVNARRIERDGKESYASVAEVRPGERVAVLTGEGVPFDGEVTEGECMVSEAVITGEPTPVGKVTGDPVVAGSTVLEGRLDLRVRRRFEETLLYRITESIQHSLEQTRGRLRSADRVASWFAPGVLALAAGVWLARLALFGLDHALSADGWFPSVAVLAVACPCAFSLAGVTAITAATGALLRQGFLVRDPAHLEQLHQATQVIFDKTGTVTMGQMTVEEVRWRDDPDHRLLGQVLALEAGSLHPVAHAIRAHLVLESSDQQGPRAPDQQEAPEELAGQGRRARVDGYQLMAGSAGLFGDLFDPGCLSPRHTVVWFGKDGRAEGCFLITDQIRPGSKETVDTLHQDGLTTQMLSGDRQETTAHVAAEVGIQDATGDVSLEQKQATVAAHQAAGRPVAYVGDGTNDALAMGEATVSVAVARSTDEALSASGFVALHGGIQRLPELLAMGRRLRVVIRANYIWAFAFNAVLIPLAASGELQPLLAMLLMLGSSIAVLLNSLRMRSA